jgi:hypothetical protein
VKKTLETLERQEKHNKTERWEGDSRSATNSQQSRLRPIKVFNAVGRTENSYLFRLSHKRV